jgi:transcription termination factor Rho
MNGEEKLENTIQVEGILETQKNKSGILLNPRRHGKVRTTDPFIPKEMIRRFKLKKGSYIVGRATEADNFKSPKVCFVETIDGVDPKDRKNCLPFQELLTIAPEDHLKLETADGRMTNRIIDLFCPIGKGTRGLIVAPPRTGKTTLLQDIAQGAIENHPDVKLIVLLVDERPEEVTDFQRSVPAEIFASSNDEELKSHIRVADIAIERAKRLVETGHDVILLLDSITRLSRAHNSAGSGSGRTMTGGLDIRALEKPRQLFSAARNTEEGGSLTIVASALIETGSRMDDLIFQEFKGTGNMEMVLDRKLAELRIWPAININASGTRREELLLPRDILAKVGFHRRALAPLKPDDATETLIERMEKTKTNQEFLALLTIDKP